MEGIVNGLLEFFYILIGLLSIMTAVREFLAVSCGRDFDRFDGLFDLLQTSADW